MKPKYFFRAKYIDSNQWVYGGGVWNFPRACLMIGEDHHGEIVIKPVKKETVGQSTGIKDICGALIFEGDVLICINPDNIITHIGVVTWDKKWGNWYAHCNQEDPPVHPMHFSVGYKHGIPPDEKSGVRIVGNIFDDIKLKKGHHGKKLSTNDFMPGDSDEELGKAV
jgi:hypothetical protein